MADADHREIARQMMISLAAAPSRSPRPERSPARGSPLPVHRPPSTNIPVAGQSGPWNGHGLRLPRATSSPFDADCLVRTHGLLSPREDHRTDNPTIDCYSMRRAVRPADLPLAQLIAFFSAAAPLQPGSVARIFTGAPVPAGADAIVMQEDALVLEGGRVQIKASPRPLYTSDAADEQRGVDIGGRRYIKNDKHFFYKTLHFF